MADIISNGHQSFFQKSLTYNSIVGGRYNPANSFGILYTANNPVLASLEVLFHIYDNKRKYLTNMAKNSEDFSSTFDTESPTLAKNLIAVFCINIEDRIPIEDYTSPDKIKDLCSGVGFSRYSDHEDFDDDFIFGNTYEVSRIAGCHLNTATDPKAFKFKSARIKNTLEHNDFFNIIIPERFIKDEDLSLVPEYFIIETAIDIQEQEGAHAIKLKIQGQENITSSFHLEKYLDEKKVRNNSERMKNYRPVIPDDFQPNLNTRGVLFQRFQDNKILL